MLAGSWAGAADPPSKPIDFKYRNASLRFAIDRLISEHQVPIVYQTEQLAYRQVTASCRECTVEQALGILLEDTPLNWRRVGGQYVLARDYAHCGRIRGTVVENQDGAPIDGARITLTPKENAANGEAIVMPAAIKRATDAEGRFEFDNLPPGRYLIQAEAEGFTTNTLQPVAVARRKTVNLDVKMELTPLPLQEIIVTPGYYNMDKQRTLGKRIFGREEMQQVTYFSDDIFRVADHVPGVTNAELSGEFRIRGGHNAGALMLFDGVELIRPFHLKSLGGGFSSIIDADNVSKMELLTGGFPAEYGDRMNGVLNLVSAMPASRSQATAEWDILGTKFKAEGRFLNGRAGFVASNRNGSLDLDLDIANLERVPSEITANYDDFYAKFFIWAGDRHLIAASYLAGDDTLFLLNQVQGPPEERIEITDSKDDSDYYWLNVVSQWSSSLASHTTVSMSRHDARLDLSDNHGDRRYLIDSESEFESRALRQDWRWRLNDRHYVKWGMLLKREEAAYDYFNRREDFDSVLPENIGETDIEIAPESESLGLYLSDRFRARPNLTVETGVRYDRQSHLEEDQWSPRIHAAYEIGPGNTVKLGWGRFFQSQGVHELQVEDGVDRFWPAELAEHWGLGYDHVRDNGWEFRGELYYKGFDKVRPRFENYLDPQASQGELLADRILIFAESGTARGLELTAKKRSRHWTVMAAYALAKAEDRIDGVATPRQWDQRHGLNLAVSFTRGEYWRFNFSWQWRSGWRVTGIDLDFPEDPSIKPDALIGPLYGDRLPEYHRMDLRVDRYIPLGRNRAANLFLEIFNAYDRDNIRGLDDQYIVLDLNGQPELASDFGTWLPMIGSFGVNLKF